MSEGKGFQGYQSIDPPNYQHPNVQGGEQVSATGRVSATTTNTPLLTVEQRVEISGLVAEGEETVCMYMYVCMYVCMYIYIYMCVCVCVCDLFKSSCRPFSLRFC